MEVKSNILWKDVIWDVLSTAASFVHDGSSHWTDYDRCSVGLVSLQFGQFFIEILLI